MAIFSHDLQGELHTTLLKEVTIETIRRMPDECTLEDIMYQINFVAQVLEGFNDADEGKLITTEELLKRVEMWAK
jgi:hypothetical protein